MNNETQKLLETISRSRQPTAPFTIGTHALPHAALAYSMCGEDLYLRKIFKRRVASGEKGIYVDIGSASPIEISNTYYFYCLGWRGLCIDANVDMAASWSAVRSEDTYITAAVGEIEGNAQFLRHKTHPGMSRMAFAQDRPAEDYEQSCSVNVRRLDSLFAEHIGDRRIQFMTIDVEGAELGVLKSNDWRRWRPEIIMLECINFAFDAPFEAAPIAFLAEQGYVLRDKINSNIVMSDVINANAL